MIAAIDVSLASTSIGTYDAATDAVVDELSVEHELDAGEGSALTWLSAIADGWRRLGSPVVEAVGVAAFGGGLVTIDRDRRPVRAVWDDDRSQPDAGWCAKKLPPEWWRAEVGLVPEARHAVTKMSWLHRSEAENWVATQQFALPVDFIVSELAGIDRCVTSTSSLAGYGLFRSSSDGPHTDVLTLIDGERDWSTVIPAIVPHDRPVGRWNDAVVLPGFDRDAIVTGRTKPQVVREIARRVIDLLQ